MGLNSTGLDTAKPLSVDDRVRLACSRQFFGHVDAQPARGAATEARDAPAGDA